MGISEMMSLVRRTILNFPDPQETAVLKTGFFSHNR